MTDERHEAEISDEIRAQAEKLIEDGILFALDFEIEEPCSAPCHGRKDVDGGCKDASATYIIEYPHGRTSTDPCAPVRAFVCVDRAIFIRRYENNMGACPKCQKRGTIAQISARVVGPID